MIAKAGSMNGWRRGSLVTALGCAALGVPASPSAGQPGPASGRPVEPPGVFRVRFDRRPVLEIGDVLRFELGGRIDADAMRTDAGASLGDGRVEWSGRRLELAGRVTARVAFELSREVGVEREAWRDLFADVRLFPQVSVRGGRFKTPFSEERTRSAGKLDFVRRSLAARVLAPGRAVGVMGHGRAARRRMTYEAGVFRDQGESADPESDDPVTRERGARPTWAARLTLRPFARATGTETASGSLRVGASMLRSENLPGLTQLGTRTAGRRTPILGPINVNGPRTGVGLEAQWSPGPVRVAGEWIEVREARHGQAIDGSHLADLVGRGWYASATWRVVRPPRAGSTRLWLRSLELGARAEAIAFGTGGAAPQTFVHPRSEDIPWHRLRAYTCGLTWTVNRWGRIQANAVAERPGGLATEWSSVVRFQFQM